MSTLRRTPRACRGRYDSALRGFTLVEVMVAATLGALLLLAAATSAGQFGRQVEYLRDDAVDVLAEALADVSHEARYAWCAQVPDPRHLVLLDSKGGQTTYAIENGALSVTRPDGSQGVVSSTITSASFTAQDVARYREAAPVQRSATLWAKPAPLLAVPQAYVVEPDEQVALGFMTSSPAPVAGSVAGVPEQTLSCTLSLLNVKLAAVTPAHGSLTIRLYRARGPGDARPEGAVLGQVAVALSGLPRALTLPDLTGAGLKNTYDSSAGQQHGRGGGLLGNLGSTKLVLPPTTSVPIDLSALGAAIVPGRAYTLVLDNTADDVVALEGYVLASGQLSGVYLGSDSTPLVAQPISLPRSLDGTATMTRTTATSVARSVLVELTNAAGSKVSGTVAVLGASLIEDPWLGAIPGELGP